MSRSVFVSQGMYHSHTTESLLRNKVQAIVKCYLRSPTSPPVQVDVPPALAEQAIRKPTGPYLFRETQV